MQKTFKEIEEMIKNGTLHHNQSTQRKFVYADMEAQLSSGKVTKAGSVINAVLEEGIQLPAVYFWYNTDTNQLNIHDGKQRLLSFYYFKNPSASINIATIRNGRQVNYNILSQADKDTLDNYTFDIVERTGNSEEEERSFYLINTNSVNLTPYECISGMLHGTFLKEFEAYIDARSKVLDAVKPIGRGEQAYKLLLTMFDFKDAKKLMSNDKTMLKVCDRIRPMRNNMFVATDFKFNKILEVFNELMRAVPKLKEDRALDVAAYIVRSDYAENIIINYYRDSKKIMNDIASWDIATHKTAIDSLINGVKLDPLRFFSKDVKDELYRKSPRCAHINGEGIRCSESSYDKLFVDHIIPWSKGGLTKIDNAQLLCAAHNSSKGNKED